MIIIVLHVKHVFAGSPWSAREGTFQAFDPRKRVLLVQVKINKTENTSESYRSKPKKGSPVFSAVSICFFRLPAWFPILPCDVSLVNLILLLLLLQVHYQSTTFLRNCCACCQSTTSVQSYVHNCNQSDDLCLPSTF